jgi:hypothetical protein
MPTPDEPDDTAPAPHRESLTYRVLHELASGATWVEAAAAAVTGCTPAWVVGARAIDEARAARGQAGPVTALTASALGLDDVKPPTWQRQGRCRVCSTTTEGARLCTDCAEGQP